MAGGAPRAERRAGGPAGHRPRAGAASSRRLLDRLAPHAEELGSTEDLERVEDILENGNGASRQAVVYEANHDLREVVAEIVAATVPEEADIPQE